MCWFFEFNLLLAQDMYLLAPSVHRLSHKQSVFIFSFSFASLLTDFSISTRNSNAYNSTYITDIALKLLSAVSQELNFYGKLYVWVIMLALLVCYNLFGQSFIYLLASQDNLCILVVFSLMSPPCCMCLMFLIYNCSMLTEVVTALKDQLIPDLW